MKVIAFAAALSLFALAPVHTASAQATSQIDCSNESWIIQGDKGAFNDVQFSPQLADTVREKWGDEVLGKLEAAGRLFTAGVAE